MNISKFLYFVSLSLFGSIGCKSRSFGGQLSSEESVCRGRPAVLRSGENLAQVPLCSPSGFYRVEQQVRPGDTNFYADFGLFQFDTRLWYSQNFHIEFWYPYPSVKKFKRQVGSTTLTKNCNLEVVSSHGVTVWSSNTGISEGSSKECHAQIQDDGNFVVYESNTNTALWSTRTAEDERIHREKGALKVTSGTDDDNVRFYISMHNREGLMLAKERTVSHQTPMSAAAQFAKALGIMRSMEVSSDDLSGDENAMLVKNFPLGKLVARKFPNGWFWGINSGEGFRVMSSHGRFETKAAALVNLQESLTLAKGIPDEFITYDVSLFQ